MAKFSERQKRIVRTAALYFSFFALGLNAAIPGPTLLDLQQIVNTDTSHIAFIYLARSSGYLVGSLLGGIVFDLIQRKQLALVFCNLTMTITSFIIPWSRSIESLIAVLAIGGVSLGAIDTGANVLCLNIWGKDSAPYFQALHFLFGLGAFLAPLVAEPFLSPPCFQNTSTVLPESNKSLVAELELFSDNSTINNLTNCILEDIPPITYAYSIVSACSLLITIYYFVLAIVCPWSSKRKSEEGYEPSQKRSLAFTLAVTIIAQLVLTLYAGIEIGYGQMIATFAVKGQLQLTKSVASFITALYWGTFTFSRGLSIFFSYKVPASKLVFADTIVITAACFILKFCGSHSVEMLSVGTFLLAFGCASFYPSVISWVERYIDVNNKIASLFVIAGCLGEMVIPMAVSQHMRTKPDALMEIILICQVISVLCTAALWQITCRREEKH